MHILIADDHGVVRRGLRDILADALPGADFSEACNGDEVLSRLQKARTSLVVLDISMPVMDAWEFLEQFEKLDAHIKNRVKIHILSSSVNKQDMARAQSNKNVEYYLIKPLTKESIRLIVHVLNKRLGIETTE